MIAKNQKSYICVCVFRQEKPVLLVDRSDGEWCFLCGGPHPDDATYHRVVGIGHLIDRDPSLREVLDLPADWEAERSAAGQPWIRSKCPAADI